MSNSIVVILPSVSNSGVSNCLIGSILDQIAVPLNPNFWVVPKLEFQYLKGNSLLRFSGIITWLGVAFVSWKQIETYIDHIS